MDANRVKQWARNSFLIFCDQRSRTGTGPLCIPLESTEAGFHSRDKLEISRKLSFSCRFWPSELYLTLMARLRTVG